jgi:hypothetical protein
MASRVIERQKEKRAKPMFNQPNESGGFFKPAEHDGALVLFTSVGAPETRFDTLRNADVEQVRVDFVDFNDGELKRDVIVSHIGIVSRIKNKQMILGRIGQAETRSGKQAWILGRFSDEDQVIAKAWLDAQPTFASPEDDSPALSAAAKLLRSSGVAV